MGHGSYVVNDVSVFNWMVVLSASHLNAVMYLK